MTKTKTTTTKTARHSPALKAKDVVKMGFLVNPKKIDENGAFGYCIAVVDRGFVWIGDCMYHGDSLYVVGGHNIRTWGAKKGLGQLAMTGPTAETELDPVPCVIVPKRALIALIPTKVAAEKWNKHAASKP